MTRTGNRWVVVGPDNFAEYLEQIQELQQAKLREVNQRIQERLKTIVRAGRLQRYVRSYGYFSDYLHLELPVTNIGSDTITLVAARLHNVASRPATDNDTWLLFSGLLLPGRSARAAKTLDYNRFIDWHVSLRYSDGLVPEVFAVYLRGNAPADTISTFASWNEYAQRAVRGR
jgi:hypothetical protein